jgi:hypothetical protein
MIFQLNENETQLVRNAQLKDAEDGGYRGAMDFGSNVHRPDNLRRVMHGIAHEHGVETRRAAFNPHVVMVASDHYGMIAYMATEDGEKIDMSKHEVTTTPFDEVKSSIILSIDPSILNYRLIKTHHRLTFDIISQHPDTRYRGEDDGPYFRYTATNGYEIFSRSRMDIHTERVWLLGAKDNRRSGTIPYSDNTKRDRCAYEYHSALSEWILLWKQGKLPTWR